MLPTMGVLISCRNDGSQAIIDYLSPQNINGYPITVDDVMTALRLHNVVNGIMPFDIEEAVKRAVKSGQPQSGVVVAQTRTEKELYFHGSEGKIPAPELSARVARAREVFALLQNPDKKLPGFQATLVTPGERLYQMDMQDSENIFGKPIRDLPLPVNLHVGENVRARSADNSITVYADKTGYLAVDEHMRLCVIEPFKVSSDLLRADFIVLPLPHDKLGLLLETYLQAHEEKVRLGLSVGDRGKALQEITALLEAGARGEIFLCQGVAPVEGKPSFLKHVVELNKRPDADEEGRVDYREFSPYCIVSENQLLAEYHYATPGVPGRDVFGREIPAGVGDEIELVVGSNVQVAHSPEVDLLLAATDGILISSEKRIEVSESLMIQNDIGANTGNIRFSKNIIVAGDVKGGYFLESGGDITIRGSIEAGARVLCGGNLTVLKGIFGHDSHIMVKGVADVGYIQEGRLQAGGDVKVYKYISDSYVKSRGNLTVKGQGVKGNERGAVMGGEIYALGSVHIHSAGTKSMPTKLGCGFDPDLYKQLKQSRATLNAIETHVLQLQQSTGMDLKSPQLPAQLKRLQPDKKQLLAEKLKEMRELLLQRERLAQRIEELQKQTFATDPEKASITIERHLVPKLVFQIMESIHIETNFMSNLILRKGRQGVYITSFAKDRKGDQLV